MPAQVGVDTDWLTVSAAAPYHTCAVKVDGSLFCWGANEYGQLGDDTAPSKDAPTQVGADTDWRAVSLGYSYSCGLKTDGSLFCWGLNSAGQLGDGAGGYLPTDPEFIEESGPPPVTRDAPTEIAPDSDWEAISAGEGHSCGLKTDGSLFCWGSNGDGQLGNGTSDAVDVPTQVGVDTDWEAISAGDRHSCGLKTDGSLLCWGDNHSGQLGDGTSGRDANRDVPTRVGLDTDWQAISAGDAHSCGLKANGSLFCWGSITMGPRADGTYGRLSGTDVPTPVPDPHSG